ncbi:unnamed protein product [Lactuca saligna]|uniref:HAT C-terminal dimerisation domain-containing protein n=1 Tax=Lactuca saligna TaxID=75948 RepID=A0AA36ECL3_LACSI|nr:unnamed protein product [Lactuca saligna]
MHSFVYRYNLSYNLSSIAICDFITSIGARQVTHESRNRVTGLPITALVTENASRIALTSDMWTTSNQKKGYMAITTHYIYVNWKLQNQIMSFIHVPSPHTADALSQAMMECFLEWNIDNKLSTLTLDNCSTNDAIVDKLLAIVLDPRYKLKLINYFFPKLYGNEARGEIMQVRNIITELFEEYKKKHNAKQGASWKRQCETNVFEGRGSTLSKSTWELDFENMRFLRMMDWKKLSWMKIARDILAIPISSVASESAFSMSGNKVTKQRNRLKAETVGALMYSQSKKQGEPKAFDQTDAYDEDVK